jgi:hypothetical protein
LETCEARPMRVAVLLVVGLYIVAHFLPAYRRENPWHDPVDGWEISSRIVYSLLTRPLFAVVHDRSLFSWLANPLFCLGAAALLAGSARHRRVAGVVAVVAGTGALSCLVAYGLIAPPFSSSFRLILLTGCYLWIAAMVLLVLAGLYVAFPRKATAGSRCGHSEIRC